jgi:hypothetical protein
MNESAHAGFVGKFNAEPFAGSEANARASVRTDEPEDASRPAIYLDRAGSGDETLRRRRCGAHRNRQDGQDASGEGGAEKTAARDGRAYSRLVSVMSRRWPCRARVWAQENSVKPAMALAVSAE